MSTINDKLENASIILNELNDDIERFKKMLAETKILLGEHDLIKEQLVLGNKSLKEKLQEVFEHNKNIRNSFGELYPNSHSIVP
jgi:hypothetical protein